MTSINHLLAAIDYAIDPQTQEGLEFLRLWRNGDFKACQLAWPDAPFVCYELYLFSRKTDNSP